MADLSAERFTEFFQALWGCRPFTWQSELARRVLTRNDSPWPQAIALPTAAGKTACIEIAVYALAASLRKQESVVRCTAPRRIFFVVDRRVIVDEAHDRARQLARMLAAAKDGILQEVADALRQIAYGRSGDWQQEPPLLIFQLRGGMYRSEAWARSPLQPIVVASTVDQVGSRLLFRAYGRGPGMWPVLAGLVGNDSLILLDEAHCAKPFLETLRSVARYRKLAKEPMATPFYPVVLSATPPSGITDVFQDTSNEPSDPDHALGRRQLAHKPTAILDPVPGRSSKKFPDPFGEALAQRAIELAQDEIKAVVIFANRVATARSAHACLQAQGYDAILLTGRMRALDRDDIVEERLSALSTKNSETRILDRPIFVVATQTLEVGADLDFDGLITECASLDALRQRFGRLNRGGRPISTRAAILVREEQSENDPVYGTALTATWAWLNEQAGTSREVDMGVAHLTPLLPTGEKLEALNAPSLRAPVLLPTHLDFLAQTSPIPVPSPEVSLFLHGPTSAPADVQVCWRVDIHIDSEESKAKALDTISYCPPASVECLPVPIWVFRQWMSGGLEKDESADVEGERTKNGDEISIQARRLVIRWPSREEASITDDPDKIRPGDVVVIPTASNGDWRLLGDLAPGIDGTVVLDWGDRAYRTLRAQALLRINPDVLKSWPISEELKAELYELATRAEQELENDPESLTAELREHLKRLSEQMVPRPWAWLPEVAEFLAKDRKLSRNIIVHPFGGLILRGSRRMHPLSEQADVFTDEDDASASGTVPIPLSEHLPGVAQFARRYTNACDLSKTFSEAVELAALLHDLGKADPRFQTLLRNGQRFAAGELLAKSESMPKGRGAYERARRAADYPEGGRHELLSVRLAESAEDRMPKDPQFRDLVLHLIASHHGYCRPFAPVVHDERPVNVSFELLGQKWSHSSATNLERLNSGVSERFWRLVRRYGWWGLAWLEALLRLADHRRSEAEQIDWERRHV